MLQEQKLRALTDDERLGLGEIFYQRVVSIAKKICGHFPPGSVDERGHQQNPCPDCVKQVREITYEWHLLLRDQAVKVAERALQVANMPYLGLHHAYEVVAAQLEPQGVKASEKYGPL